MCYATILNTLTTAGGGNGCAPIGDDMRRPNEGGNVGPIKDDFTDVSGDQLGMLIHTIWWYL